MKSGSDNARPLHLRLEVVALNDQLPAKASVCIFSTQGGSIGRGSENDYVLSDTESVVSRVHALVSYADGNYFLTDQSTNGTFVNDSPTRLQSGVACQISDGDRLLMGNYLVVASLVAADTPLDRDAPLLKQLSQSPFQPDIIPEESEDRADDYSALPEMNGWPNKAKRPSWFPVGEEDESEVSGSVPAQGDAHEERPPVPIMQQHMVQPVPDRSRETAPEADQPVEQSKRRISSSEVPTGYIPGALQFEAPSRAERLSGDAEQEDPFSSGLSKQAKTAEQSLPTESEASGGRVAAKPAQQSERAPITTPSVIRGPAQVPPPENGQSLRGSALGQVDTDLLAALLSGLGSTALEIPPERASEFANEIGQLTREAIQGMIDTLRLRDEFKREFYVPVTRIAPTDNNVFKHSANVDDGLARAFSGAVSTAYLGPAESTRQAFQDIAAHQLALVAGMQAAVGYLLELFSPKALQQRIGKSRVLDGVLPQMRKAHMWEQFEKDYTRIAEQAEEDFQRVFGEHFERAYTQQIHQLHSAGFGGRKDPES